MSEIERGEEPRGRSPASQVSVERLRELARRIELDFHHTAFCQVHNRAPISSTELEDWIAQRDQEVTLEEIVEHVARHYERLHQEGFL
jgi:hypothetical protein